MGGSLDPWLLLRRHFQIGKVVVKSVGQMGKTAVEGCPAVSGRWGTGQADFSGFQMADGFELEEIR